MHRVYKLACAHNDLAFFYTTAHNEPSHIARGFYDKYNEDSRSSAISAYQPINAV